MVGHHVGPTVELQWCKMSMCCPNPELPLITTAHVQTKHFLNSEDWFKHLLKTLIIMLSWTQQRNGRQHNRSWTQCNSMCNYDPPTPLNVSRTSENIWESIKEGIKAAKALRAGDIRVYWQGSWKSARCCSKCQSAPFEQESDFSWANVFSWRSGSMWAGPEPQIPQRSGRVFWQQWKCKTQIHVCLGAGMGLKRRRGKKNINSWKLFH